MAGIPTYDIEENLRRIDMQRSLKFIIVEGIDDVPIYENIVSSSTNGQIDFEVIHSGGKPRIKTIFNGESYYQQLYIYY